MAMSNWKSDEELFNLINKTRLDAPVVGDILDRLGHAYGIL